MSILRIHRTKRFSILRVITGTAFSRAASKHFWHNSMYKIAEALILFSSALGRKQQALQCLGLQQVLVYFVCWALLPRTGRANALFVSDVFGKKRCFVCLTSETRHRTLTSFKDTALNRDNMKLPNVWGFFCMWFGKSKLLCHHGWRLCHQEPFSLLRSWYTLLPMTFQSSICLSSHRNSGTKLFIQLYFWSTNELKNQNVTNMFFSCIHVCRT